MTNQTTTETDLLAALVQLEEDGLCIPGGASGSMMTAHQHRQKKLKSAAVRARDRAHFLAQGEEEDQAA